MSDVLQGPRRGSPRLWSVVVPTDTASVIMQVAPLISVSTFVDTIFAPEVNSVLPGNHIARRTSALKRSIYVCTRTSSAMSGAPDAVTTLAASLAAQSEQSYLIHGSRGGDVWIVGNTSTALRHGMYDYLKRVGVTYLLPHVAWRIPSLRGSLELDVSEIKSPVVKGFGWDGNGGLGSGTVPPIPDRQTCINAWTAWKQQTRNPSEILSGFGDGDEGFTTARQQELDGDHTMLAWRTAQAKRGYSESGNYPTGDCASMPNTLAKLCMTHHGASGTGSYPAAPAGPDVWTTQAGLAWTESCSVDPPGGPITPDPGPDNATNPSANYTAFNGLIKLHAEQHRDMACTRILANGYPHPVSRVVSSEPNDGANFCQCSRCTDLLRSGPYSAWLTPTQQTLDANDSDKCYHLMNQDQAFLTHWFQNATFVPMSGMLGYVSHVGPPNIPIDDNSVTVVLYASALNIRALPSEVLDLWIAKRTGNAWGQFTLGVSPQWLTDNTNFAAPKWPSPAIGSAYFAGWIGDGFTLCNAQTGFSSMTMGLLFGGMSELCWSANYDTDAGVDLFFDSLGAAGPAIRVMFERWWQWFEHNPHEIAVSFRDVQTAQAALDAASDASLSYRRADIQRRLNHVTMFVEWQRRYSEYIAAITDYDTGKLTATGPAVIPTVKLSAVRTAPSIIRIECTTGGAPGTAQFRWTKNADAATIIWEQSAQTIPTTPFTFTLGTTGRAVTFANSTYTSGQAWDETPNVTAQNAATDRVLEWAWKCCSSNVIHSDRIADKIYLRVPIPYSNSKDGTAPPAITVGAVGSGSIKPTAGSTYVEIECDGAGARGTATIRWRVNGGGWTTVTTAASLTLTAAGIAITCAAGTYSLDNRWFITLSLNHSKWNIDDPAASAGWASIVEPSTAALAVLVTSGVADYTPISGITRRVFDETSFQAFDTSAATTLRNGPKFSTPHAYVIRKPAGTVTLKLNTTGLGGTVGQQIRVLLQDMAGVLLQEWAFTPPLTTPAVVSDVVITQAAGNYRLVVVNCAATNSLSYLQTPENVSIVLVNDWFDAVAATTRGFSFTDREYFYVPVGETKIAMVFRQGAGTGIAPVQFYDPSGVAVTTTFYAPNLWVCEVGAGQDGAAWSFTGYYPFDNLSTVFFENCPARIAPSARQLLIP